jgi:hypothetical protein
MENGSSVARAAQPFLRNLRSRSFRSLAPATVMIAAMPKNRHAEIANRMIQRSAVSVTRGLALLPNLGTDRRVRVLTHEGANDHAGCCENETEKS